MSVRRKKICPYFFNLFSESRFWVWNALPRPTTTKACKMAQPQNNRFMYHVSFRWQLPFGWCGNLHIHCSNWFCYALLKVIFFALSGNIFQRVQETAKVQVSIYGVDAQIRSLRKQPKTVCSNCFLPPISNLKQMKWECQIGSAREKSKQHYCKKPIGERCQTALPKIELWRFQLLILVISAAYWEHQSKMLNIQTFAQTHTIRKHQRFHLLICHLGIFGFQTQGVKLGIFC